MVRASIVRILLLSLGPQVASAQTCSMTADGQISVYIPGAVGHGCGAPWNEPNCCFCVYDMDACSKAYGAAACRDTNDARRQQGFNGCAPAPAPPPPPPPAPTCSRTADGQMSVYIPGAVGHGCGAPWNDPNCCFCVYDMDACSKAYGVTACSDTYNTRLQQGFNGCVRTQVEVTANGTCPCYYDGRTHYCNPSPFPNDDRCVCGPKGSDWKTPEQCKPPNVEVTAKGTCPCYYDGRTHNCNPSPFPNDDRCVCGPKGSDWKTPEQCKPPSVVV